MVLIWHCLTKFHAWKWFSLKIQAAPRKELVICFFSGTRCTQDFYSVKCSKSVTLVLNSICGEQNLSCSVLIFHHLLYSDFKHFKHFPNLVESWKPLAINTNCSTINDFRGPEYATESFTEEAETLAPLISYPISVKKDLTTDASKKDNE